MAPEIVKQTAYTSKADIWSVGCLVVEMLTGQHPWADLTQMQAIFRVRLATVVDPMLICLDWLIGKARHPIRHLVRGYRFPHTDV